MYRKINKIHLIGIGGIGMSGIAQLLHNHGYTVSGSDIKESETLKQLASKGIKVYYGHRKENIENAELVVFSSAIKEDNPEIIHAKQEQIPIIPRAEMLAELMRLKYGIAVAGAHGKTTTTSMIGIILIAAGLDPTIVVGGRMDNIGGTNARLGKGDFMVVEADESDGSFSKLSPSISVVTNIDQEHLDHYQSMANLKKAFLNFLNKPPFYGTSIFYGDNTNLRLLRSKITRRYKTYGFSNNNHYKITDYTIKENGSEFKISINNEKTYCIKLNVHGKHNALNATAAFAVADELDISIDKILEGLATFSGVQRRFQIKGQISGVTFIDDYAHHPSEIEATLTAAREKYKSSRIFVLFQPHRYSRIENLFDRFTTCFFNCDMLAISDIYSAGEKPINEISSAHLVENIIKLGRKNVIYVSSLIEGIQTLLNNAKNGDIILTLGAGDITSVYSKLF